MSASSSSKKKANRSREEKARKYLDLEDTKGYSGTFRWIKATTFPRMPGPFRADQRGEAARLLCYRNAFDWNGYFELRDADGNSDLVKLAKENLHMVDGLSFPLTIIRTMNGLGIRPNDDGKTIFNIVVIGASEKAEQRVAQDTNYFEEIGHAFPNSKIRLWITGPEVGMNVKPRAMEVPNMELRIKKCTAGNFVLCNDEIKEDPTWRDNTIFVGFNCGFGNWTETKRVDLLLSWIPDLYILTSLPGPIIFTCANDCDVVGELQVHLKVVGSKFLIGPKDNQFAMATVFQPEEQDIVKGAKGGQDELKQMASNGNRQVYAVQGWDTRFRVVVGDLRKDEGRRRLNDALHKHDDFRRRLAVLVNKLPDPMGEEGPRRGIKEERPSQAGPGGLSQAREERPAKEPTLAPRREKEVESKGDSTKTAPKPSVENEPPARRSARPVTPSGEPPVTRTKGRSSPIPAQPGVWTFEEGRDGQKLVAKLRLPDSVKTKEEVVLDLSDRTIKCTELASGDCWSASVPEAVKPDTARAGFNMQKRVLKVTFQRES